MNTIAKVLLLALACVPAAGGGGKDDDWSWRQPHAEVSDHGDLKWKPRPYVYEKGESIRYVDFDSGDDANDGATREKPWKHHPWDPAAAGKSKACQGIHTYVFKGGVYYRGALAVAEAGKPGQPIRLTRDPSWGTGDAVLCGSERVTGWKKGADHKDIPEPEKVWFADLDYSPRAVWLLRKEGDSFRIPLTRTPN